MTRTPRRTAVALLLVAAACSVPAVQHAHQHHGGPRVTAANSWSAKPAANSWSAKPAANSWSSAPESRRA